MAAMLRPIDIRLRKPQFDIFTDSHRFKTVTAGRRFGKTFLARGWLASRAIRIPHTTHWYCAPTYRQAKQLMWGPLKDLIPKAYIRHKDETDMSLELVNRSVIALRGTDNPDSLRGPGLKSLVLDECAFMRTGIWDTILSPMLADQLGHAIFITTPVGYNWFYDLVMESQSDEEWKSFHYTTLQGGNVSPKEVEKQRARLDPRKFRQEFEASFENMSGRVYYAFDREKNVIDVNMRNYDNLPVLVGMDFNICPMTAVYGFRIAEQLHIVGEVEIENGNTELMSQELKRRFPGRNIIVYPDPTGDSRHTNAPVGETDFTILRRNGFQVYTPGHPYAVADKINTMNAAFENASGDRRVFLARGKTKSLQKALDGFCYKEGTSIPDKDSGLDHCSDGCGYLVMAQFPIVQPARRIKTVGI